MLVTGAAGNIGYSIIPLICNGSFLGPNQHVILHLLDIPPCLDKLNGVKMEVEDCAFPLLKGTCERRAAGGIDAPLFNFVLEPFSNLALCAV